MCVREPRLFITLTTFKVAQPLMRASFVKVWPDAAEASYGREPYRRLPRPHSAKPRHYLLRLAGTFPWMAPFFRCFIAYGAESSLGGGRHALGAEIVPLTACAICVISRNGYFVNLDVVWETVQMAAGVAPAIARLRQDADDEECVQRRDLMTVESRIFSVAEYVQPSEGGAYSFRCA
jgi:hypothetical protein